MMKAIALLTTLVGYTVAVKVWAYIKMNKMKVEGWEQKDFEKLLEDPKLKKYLR